MKHLCIFVPLHRGGIGGRRNRRCAGARRRIGSPPRPSSAPVAAGLVASATVVAPARAADVVSSNIVGYNKVTLQSGLNLLGSNWNVVGGNDGTLADIMDASNLPPVDTDSLEFAAEIKLWTGSGYQTYGWTGNVGDPAYDNKWVNEGNLSEVSVDAAKGSAFWVKSSTASEVIFSGEVASEESITLPVSSGLTLIANPFPETVSLKKITSTDLPAVDVDSLEFAAEIKLWTGSGYQTYGWTGNVGDPDYDNKWVNEGNLQEASAELPIGAGCWISSTSEGHVTFTK